ncbi:hypothetical protein [Hydrocarboniphaga effusa]|uniref:hypothetical protein n=1 Tax=Hydrocarboniphaga effusa TaxID=243629 RepID=UPI0031379CA9
MKHLIPNFSDWFAAWVSAGQYSSVEELELDTDVLPSNRIRLFRPSTRAGAADRPRPSRQPRVRWG